MRHQLCSPYFLNLSCSCEIYIWQVIEMNWQYGKLLPNHALSQVSTMEITRFQNNELKRFKIKQRANRNHISLAHWETEAIGTQNCSRHWSFHRGQQWHFRQRSNYLLGILCHSPTLRWRWNLFIYLMIRNFGITGTFFIYIFEEY